MMSPVGGFAYAQARVQARFARLPTNDDWRRLAAARGFSGFLEEARAGAHRDWVKPFSGQSDAHDIEIGLRVLYRDQVEEVADWMPRPWHSSVVWTRWLVLIPLFDHLARGGGLPGWVKRDHELRELLSDWDLVDPGHLTGSDAGILLVTGAGPVGAWRREWRRRWPRCGAESRRNLVALERLFAGHTDAFRRCRPESAWDLRRGLRDRLELLFHRLLLQPASAFVFLALVLLDLEQLRAELLLRGLFGAREDT